MPKRQRSDSVVEERVIDEYVSTCINFRTNVSFADPQGVTDIASHVVLIGTAAQLKEADVQRLPFYGPEVAEAIKRMEPSKSITLLTQVRGKFTTITVAAVPTTASRTNCPFRPDFATDVVAGAAGALGEGEHNLDVFVRAPAGAEPAFATAIARGSPHSFSAKKGDAKRAFSSQPTAIRVVFAARNIFTGEPVDGVVVRAAELQALCTSVQLCQRLVDTPPNLLDTVVFAEIAKGYAKELGVEVEVIGGEELRERGYGGIYGVGKGAEYPPQLVTLRYQNAKATSGRSFALVGKGIIYDCGGLALKPAVHMSNMKTDMGGAAAVFCGFIATVRAIQLQSQHYNQIANLSVTLCLAENAIGPKSYRNDDILVLKSGKSVEVMNTDAEGRIVLADGVFYATNEQRFVPDVLVDMATLTGAQGVATGKRHAAIYCNEQQAEDEMVKAGRHCGDLCFPVVYCPEYHEPEYKSPCADMRNLMASTANAGVSCGGAFIASHISERFTGAHVHVDLAFPSESPAGGTGYGVSLLAEYFKRY